MAVAKKRIGDLLLEAGIIDETQLKAALGHQRQWGVRLGQALVDLKLATEADIVRALSLKFGFEVAKLDALEPYGHEQALKLFPREFTTRNNVLPMWADTANVTVAMSDPTNLTVADEIRFRTGRRVKVCIGGDREIAEAVRRCYPAEGDVEAIALDLEADSGVTGEAVFDPFGGGSKDALEAFFGGTPEDLRPSAPAAAPAAQAAPAPAPRPAPPPAAPRPGTATAIPAQAGPAPRPGTAAAIPAQGPTATRTGAAIPAPGPAATRTGAAIPVPGAPAAPAPTRTGAAIPAQGARPAPQPAPGRTGAGLAGSLPAPPARVPAGVRPPGAEPRRDAVPAAALTPVDDGEAVLATDLAPEAPAHDGGRALSAQELAILESLDRLASGAPAQPEVVKPAQAMAALIRLLIRKRLVTELEFLDELSKK